MLVVAVRFCCLSLYPILFSLSISAFAFVFAHADASSDETTTTFFIFLLMIWLHLSMVEKKEKLRMTLDKKIASSFKNILKTRPTNEPKYRPHATSGHDLQHPPEKLTQNQAHYSFITLNSTTWILLVLTDILS